MDQKGNYRIFIFFIENIPYLLVRIIESCLKSSNSLIWLNKLIIDSDKMFVNFFKSLVGLRLNFHETSRIWIKKSIQNLKSWIQFETSLSSVSRTDIRIFLKVSASWWIFEINFDWPDDRRRLFISESSKSNETVLSESIKISKPSTISSTSVVVSSLILPSWDSNSDTELWKDSEIFTKKAESFLQILLFQEKILSPAFAERPLSSLISFWILQNLHFLMSFYFQGG